MTVQKGYLLLADITGYTSFLATTSVLPQPAEGEVAQRAVG